MRQSLPDTLPSSSTTIPRSKKRRWTREQLLKHLEVLDTMPPPLPPPGRPASPSPSPVLGHKRKSDSASDPDSPAKRPRISSVADARHTQSQPHNLHHPHQPPHSHQPPSAPSASSSQPSSASNPQPAFTSRQEPEEGEVREEAPAPVQAPSTFTSPKAILDLPVRRPKRGKLEVRHFDTLHDHYHAQGRKLKYSGDARYWSTYSPSNREYRPLVDPPPINSPYHKHGGIIARLELADALLCFTYAIWNKEYGRQTCVKETWSTIEAFLHWCKAKWAAQEGCNDDAEKAFIGLIWMIEAFIHGRRLKYTAKEHLERDMRHVMGNLRANIQIAADKAEASMAGSAGSLNANSGGTPTMLPSPASITTTNSANSTPTYRDNGTPNASSSSRQPPHGHPPRPPPQVRTAPSPVPVVLLPEQYTNNNIPIPPEIGQAMKEVREPISPALAKDLQDFVMGSYTSGDCMAKSQAYLNLSVMMRCFPNTFNRMIHSTLLPTEEHEPDFEDYEGELYWPGQLVTGEGLGWVCLMGKSMIHEFGKAYGYKSLDGVVPKPQPEETADGPPPSHRPPPNPMPRSRSHFPPSNSYHHSNSTHGNR